MIVFKCFRNRAPCLQNGENLKRSL